jgi:hypothetical protein
MIWIQWGDFIRAKRTKINKFCAIWILTKALKGFQGIPIEEMSKSDNKPMRTDYIITKYRLELTCYLEGRTSLTNQPSLASHSWPQLVQAEKQSHCRCQCADKLIKIAALLSM